MGGGVGYGFDILLNMLIQVEKTLFWYQGGLFLRGYPGTKGWCGCENRELEGCKRNLLFIF